MGGIHRLRKRLRPRLDRNVIEGLVKGKAGKDILRRSGEEASPPSFAIGNLSCDGTFKSKKSGNLFRNRNEQGSLERPLSGSCRRTKKQKSVPIANRHLASRKFPHRALAILFDTLVEHPRRLKNKWQLRLRFEHRLDLGTVICPFRNERFQFQLRSGER